MPIRPTAISAKEMESEIRKKIMSEAVKAEAVDVETQREGAVLQGSKEEDFVINQLLEVKQRRRLWMILFIPILSLIIVAGTLGVVLSQRRHKLPPRRQPPWNPAQTPN